MNAGFAPWHHPGRALAPCTFPPSRLCLVHHLGESRPRFTRSSGSPGTPGMDAAVAPRSATSPCVRASLRLLWTSQTRQQFAEAGTSTRRGCRRPIEGPRGRKPTAAAAGPSPLAASTDAGAAAARAHARTRRAPPSTTFVPGCLSCQTPPIAQITTIKSNATSRPTCPRSRCTARNKRPRSRARCQAAVDN